MSASSPPAKIPANILDYAEFDLSSISAVEPTIRSPDKEVIFKPPVVTRLNGILPWDTTSDTNLCSETYVEPGEDLNYRVTIEGVIFKSDLSTIAELREQASEVEIVTEMTQELGIPTVSFDQIEIERTAQPSEGQTEFEGETVVEPLYTFQMQSKETGSDE